MTRKDLISIAIGCVQASGMTGEVIHEVVKELEKVPCYRYGGMMVSQCEVCQECPDRPEAEKPDLGKLAWNEGDDE